MKKSYSKRKLSGVAVDFKFSDDNTKQLFLRRNAQSPETTTGIVKALSTACAGCDVGLQADACLWEIPSGDASHAVGHE